jgi:Flp pilus assembly protein TadD
MARRRHDAFTPTEAHDVAMCRRAWRHRRRGDERRAMLLLRDAAHRDESDARIWALYGVQCGRAGYLEAAARALGHAVWLRVRRKEARKAQVTRDVMARVLASAA